jgi:glycosyltransferase involved in cell wall biosynthesis
MSKHKILIVTADYPPPMGGIQVFTYELEQSLKGSGHDVRILNFDGRNTSTYKYLRLVDFFYTPATRNEYFSLRNILNPFKIFDISGGFRDFVYKNMIYRVSRIEISRFKPDVVHIMKNELYSTIYNIKVPYLVSCHSSNVDIYDAPHIRYSLEHAKKIHCVSNFTKQLAMTISPNKADNMEVIYNFIDLSKYKNTSSTRKKRIITVARMSRRKNIDTLIKAFSLLPEHIKNSYEYLIVGDGDDLSYLKKYARELNESGIVFTGEISDETTKIKLLSESEVFLLCPALINGESETFGIVFLEAQALGIPVVCSKIGGIPEAVGLGGIYVDDELDPRDVSNKLLEILTNTDLYSAAKSEIEKRVGSFGKDLWFKRFLKLYEDVISN